VPSESISRIAVRCLLVVIDEIASLTADTRDDPSPTSSTCDRPTADVFLQVAESPEQMTGCWLQFPPSHVPLGLAALTTAEGPAYLHMLQTARAIGFNDAVKNGVAGDVDLGVAATLLHGAIGRLLSTTAAKLDEPRVAVTITIDNDRVTGLMFRGQNLVNAIEEQGVSLPVKYANRIRGLSLTLRYHKASASPGVEPPASKLIVPDRAHMDEGWVASVVAGAVVLLPSGWPVGTDVVAAVAYRGPAVKNHRTRPTWARSLKPPYFAGSGIP
jgi:hypothetical protein